MTDRNQNHSNSNADQSPSKSAADRFLSRRSVLKTGGTAVFSSIALMRGASARETVEVPKLISDGEVVAWLEVPRAWKEHRQHARDVLQDKRVELEDTTGVRGTELGRSSKKYGGEHGLQIFALVDDAYWESEEDLPSEIEGIPVGEESAPEVRAGGCSGPGTADNCVNHEKDKTVYPGEDVGWVGHGDGTACTRVEYNGSEHLLHCGHVFWRDCDDANSGGLTGREAEAEGKKLGETVKVDVPGDWSVIDTSLGGDYFYDIDDNDTDPKIVGYVTGVTLDNWASTDTDPCMRQMGCTTGKTYGKVYRTDADYTVSGCTDMRDEGVRTKCDFGQGDSGGPTWHLQDGEAYLVSVTGYYYNPDGLVCGGLEKGRQSAGLGAFWLANNEPISFNEDKTV